jgi:TRAP transporter 4TM/12TM fusion protein
MFKKKEKTPKQDNIVEMERTRELEGNLKHLPYYIGVIMTIFQLYVLFITPMDPFLLRIIHVSFVLMLGFMYYPRVKENRDIGIFDYLLIAGAFGLMFYSISFYEGIVIRSGVNPTPLDVVFGTLLVLMIIELARRTSGMTLPVIALIFMAYTLFGHHLPGLLGHPRYSFQRTMSFLFGVQGILSEPIGVSATVVFMFIFFGTILNSTGGGEAMIDFAKSLVGDKRGGPAKVAIISSALFGSISGSAVANVVVTGTFTIPMMKRTGYDNHFAGAVEAVASTGGQITPPVLGAAAFLIAEVLGVPYSLIVTSTIIPALLYYITLFAVVDFEAGKKSLSGVSKDELPSMKEVVGKHGLLLLPIVVLLFFLLAVGLSPIKSALYAAISVMIFALMNKNTRTRVTPKKLLDIMAQAPKDMVSTASTCSAAGIIVGTMSLTGIGHRFAVLLIELSQGNILIALMLTMVVCIILGMGVPPVAAYAIAGSAIGPALIQLGVEPLPAHLFIFYFCAMAVITPPVALASYAAAALARADMWKVGITAFKMGITGFVIPYLFVYNQVLLMQGPPLPIIQAFVTATIGVICLAGFFQGWLNDHLGWLLRILLLFAAAGLMIPGTRTDLTGLAALVIFIVLKKRGIGVLKEAAK